MQTKEFLDSVCEQIRYKPIRKQISEELENHIEEIKENYIKEGMETKEAEAEAIKQMGDSIEIGKKLDKIHRPRFDWKLVLIIVVLMFFRFLVAVIKSRPMNEEIYELYYIIKFFISIGIGLAISILIYFFDYKKLIKYNKYIYILATVILVYTLIHGAKINGRIYFNEFNIITSIDMIVMPLYIISFIGFLINKKEENIKHIGKMDININTILAIVLSILSLILLVSLSISSAFTLGIIYLIILTVKLLKTEKSNKYKIIALWGTVVVLSLLLLITILNSPVASQRLKALTNPESDPQGFGWTAMNKKVILESAKSIGEATDKSGAIGLFEEGSNFAFISILANYGWVVAITMILVIILFSIKLIIDSIKVKDFYGKLLIIGISSMFILQSIFCILMNLNLGIESNFNIPFVSYGATNLIINMMSLALILSVYRRKDI